MRQLVLTVLYRHARVPRTCIAFSERLLLNTFVQPTPSCIRHFQTCSVKLDSRSDPKNDPKAEFHEDDDTSDAEQARKSALSTQTYFDSKKRNKETFEVMLDIFTEKNRNRKGAVEFIYAALRHMEDYNVSYDLDTYKKLIKILPEGKYVPENRYQEEFYHYPKQQDCILTLLDTMERKGVCPDEDMVEILKRIFGRKGHPVKKVWRQLYWFPKFKNASPWPVPFPPVLDPFYLAKLAIERIVSVDPQSVVSIWETNSVPDALDHTYVVSGQSPSQKKLLAEHPTTKSLFVEGAFRIWVGKGSVNYFTLRADPKELKEELEDPDDVTNFDVPFIYEKSKAVIKKPTVHEQQDGTILAVCATGTSSRDALLSWIRLLEKDENPNLAEIPVIFSMKSPVEDIVPLNQDGPKPPRDEGPGRVTDQ